jgi:hypothetical protein
MNFIVFINFIKFKKFKNFIFWRKVNYRQYKSSFRKIFTEDKGEDGHELDEDVETRA